MFACEIYDIFTNTSGGCFCDLSKPVPAALQDSPLQEIYQRFYKSLK